MKKMIIYMPRLSLGGMEKALLNLFNIASWTSKYDIELFLGYSTHKEYLDMIPKNIKVYLCCKGKWNLFGKAITFFKMILKKLRLILNVDKYDVAISYAYQHPVLASLARMSSLNNIIFIHNNIELKFENKSRFKKMCFDKFSKVVCVSDEAKEVFLKLFPNYSGKLIMTHNYIDGENILNKSLETVDFNFTKPAFVSLVRCEERSKRISRIIKASKKLALDGYDFSSIIIGDGEDYEMYKKMVCDYGLEDVVFLIGRKSNPYCYLKKADAMVLSSKYEGYGIVIDEARILNVPVISTDVADVKTILNQGFGIVCENSCDGVYKGMKEFLEKGYVITNRFDYKNFNKEIDEALEKFIES